MTHLILETQLEALKHNLLEVKKAMGTFSESDLSDLLSLRSADLRRDSVNAITDAVQNARRAIRDEKGAELTKEINEIEAHIKILSDGMNAAEAAADNLARRTPVRLSEFQTTLNDELVERIIDAQLDLIDEQRGRLKEASGNEQAATVAARAVWETYATEIVPRSSEVFGEYVEFLGGIALRYTGFDRGICRIADELIHASGVLPGYRWSSVTLPARRGETLSIAHMIGIGFPEWTIWALPLGAHALGDALLRASPKMQSLVADQEGSFTSVPRSCVAAAFATYVMGPAYAAAAILLRFDAYSAFDDDDEQLTARRAQFILRTLKYLNGLDENGFATEILDILSEEWNAALRQAGHGARLDLENAVGGLSKDEIESIDGWIPKMAGKVSRSRAFGADRWPQRVVPWSEWLAAGRYDEIEAAARATDGQRHVLCDLLNAAWRCRLQCGGPRLDLQTINDETMALWTRLDPGSPTRRRSSWMAGLPASPPTPEDKPGYGDQTRSSGSEEENGRAEDP